MNFLRLSLLIVICCSRLNITFFCVMHWKLRKKRLQHFIFKLMNKRNVKIISWNNIFEHMSISFKIIEFFYFSWSNSFTTMRIMFQSTCHRSKSIWITIFAWFLKKISISNFDFDWIKSIKKIASIHCRLEKWICWNSKKLNSIQKQTKYCSNVQLKRHDLIECQKHKNQTKQQIKTSIVRFFQNFR